MTEVTDGSPVVLGVVLEPAVEEGGVVAALGVEDAVAEESIAELAGTDLQPLPGLIP